MANTGFEKALTAKPEFSGVSGSIAGETGANPVNRLGDVGAAQWTPPAIIAPAITSTADIAEWLEAVATGRWTWTRNTRCKYVDLKLDTRRGAYCILDRNGEQITFEQLRWQYPEPTPTQETRHG